MVKQMDNLDELIVCLENGVDFHTKEGELLDLFKELKQLRTAFELACKRLGRLEHTCEGCIAEACENYINDEECSKIIMSKYLQKAGEADDHC